VPFPPHTAYNELVGASTPHGTPRVPSPTPAYYDLYYIADVPDYFQDPDVLAEHFAGTTLVVAPTPELPSVPGSFSPSPSSEDPLSPYLPTLSPIASVSGTSGDDRLTEDSEDEASSVDVLLATSSPTSPIPVPYTPAQPTLPSISHPPARITSLAPLVTHVRSPVVRYSPAPDCFGLDPGTVWGCWETLPCLLTFSLESTGDESGRS
jgi:hypothetical protein